MKKVFIAFGGNQGNVVKNFQDALVLLAKENIILENFSKIYRSEPHGYKNQDFFLNAVGLFNTEKSPDELLQILLKIEKILKRERTFKNAPRPIDLDIIFYENEIIENENLIIPHKEFSRRNFVLYPLNDIAPDFVDPYSKKSINQILQTSNFSEEIYETEYKI